jgi:hypothetical protein
MSTRHLGLVAVVLGTVYLAGPAVGVELPPGAIAILGAGALAVARAPAFAVPIAGASGGALFVALHPGFALYETLLVSLLFAYRRRAARFALTLAVLALAVPKTLFAFFPDHPAVWSWISEPHLAATLFIAAYWWREARSGRLPTAVATGSGYPSAWSPSPSPSPSPTWDWALMFIFPTHAAYPISFGPGDLQRTQRVAPAAVLAATLRLAAKAAALAAMRAWLPEHRFAVLPGPSIMALGRGALWGVVALNYLELVLTLSGVADLVIALARLYGWPLASPFRWALLAWNPVELWRRWGIYTRRFLLKTVYFPLGGSDRHRFRNVMLTFLASALLLHGGWFGSKYLRVGPGGWRDHTIYFALQGAAVCACLGAWRLVGKAPSGDRQLRWSWSRAAATVATQGLSALLHIIILVPSVPLGERWRLIARCMGG